MKFFVATLTLLAFASCWGYCQDHKGMLIFSIKLIESDGRLVDENGRRMPGPEIKDGVYFYLEKHTTPEMKTIQTVTGFQYKGGEISSLSGLGSVRTETLLSELDVIGFKTFDFHALIKEKDYELEYLTVGGAKYEIFIDYKGEQFSFVEWNPHGIIESYAEKENKVMKLKEFIDRFALLFGRRQFGL
jgi:hypothetical protein